MKYCLEHPAIGKLTPDYIMFLDGSTFFTEDILRAEWRGMTPMQKLMALVIEHQIPVWYGMLVLCVVAWFMEGGALFYTAAALSVVLWVAVKIYRRKCRERIVLYNLENEEWVEFATYPGVAAQQVAELIDFFATAKSVLREVEAEEAMEGLSEAKQSYLKMKQHKAQELFDKMKEELPKAQEQLDEQMAIVQEQMATFS